MSTEKTNTDLEMDNKIKNMKVDLGSSRSKNREKYRTVLGVQEFLLKDESDLSSDDKELKRHIIEKGRYNKEVVYFPSEEDRKKMISYIHGKASNDYKKKIEGDFGMTKDELEKIYESLGLDITKGHKNPHDIFRNELPEMAVAVDEDEVPMAEVVKKDEVPESEKIDLREEEVEKREEFPGNWEFRTKEEEEAMLDVSLDTKESHRKFVKGTNEDNEELLTDPIVGEATGKTLVIEPTPDELIAEEEETGGYEFTEESRGLSETVAVVSDPILSPPKESRTTPESEILAPTGHYGSGLTVDPGETASIDTADVSALDSTRADIGLGVGTMAGDLDPTPEPVGDEEETDKEPDPEFGSFYTDQKQLKFEVKYHKVQFKMFFGALNNPNIDKVLFKNIMESVETGLLTRESVKELCQSILTASKGEILVNSVMKGDLQELHELSQLYFCLHRDLMTGPRMPMGRVPLSQLTNISRIIQSPNSTEQFDTATGVPILPQQEEVQQAPSILTPQEIERRSRMVSDELGISRPASIFADIGRNVRAHNKKEIKIVQEPNLKIQATDIAIRDTSAYSHLKINFKRDSKE